MPPFFRLLFSSLLIFYLGNLSGFAQNDRIRSNAALAEKIYLQLDKNIYMNNQDIWFKAIVADAANNMPGTLSGILYVELISPEEKILEKKLVKLKDGIGNNFFKLSPKYPPGKYLLRAYTRWNMNFPDFIFRTYVDIFSAVEQDEEAPIGAVNLVEKNSDEFWLQTNMKPGLLDSLQEKWVNVYLTLDGKKDSISVKEKNNTYFLKYAVPKNVNVATVTMETSKGTRYTKTIALNEDVLDVQFFPESGELVGGLLNRIGFKAVNYAGIGMQVEGEVLNNQDKVVATFKSNSLGMGDFSLFADSGSYYARINSPFRERDTIRHALPKVVRKGNILSVIKGKDLVRFHVSSNYRTNDSVFIEVGSRGLAYYELKGKLNNGIFNASISSTVLPQGIIAVTLLDGNKQVMAERIFFNEKPEEQLNINLATRQPVYEPRDKTNLEIQILNKKGNPVKANLSVLVINKEHLGTGKNKNMNILSYFLLGSELKGRIEDPAYYFDMPDEVRLKDLDVLMLTQGWRKYNYNKPPEDILTFLPEESLQVSGTVGGTFSTKKRKEGVNLTMMTFGDTQSFYSQKTDSLGRFNFLLNDEFGRDINILIQSKSKNGKNRNYTINFDKKEEPKIVFNHQQSIVPPDSTVYKIIENERERKVFEDSFDTLSGVTQLDEVFLEGTKMTPQRQKVTDEYGKPETVIPGEAIHKEEKKWSFGLYSVLMFSFPEQIRIERDRDGTLRAQVNNGEVSLIVIDGIPVMNYNYSLIPNIPPSEVKSVEIIEYANKFSSLYQKVYPQVSPLDIPMQGNVIAIYTNAGKGLYSVGKPKGIVQTSIPVFAANKEFYQPKYDNISVRNSEKPDLRSVIEWEPQIVTDAAGNASVSFYNSDISGNMLVIVEAIAEDGTVGYQTLEYEVDEK